MPLLLILTILQSNIYIFFQFGGLESPLTGVSDQFYKVFKKKWSRELLTFIVVFSAFVCSIPCATAVSKPANIVHSTMHF